MVVIGSRANYGTAKSILASINNSDRCSLLLVASASAVLDKFGDVSKLMESDGLKIDYRLFNLVDGSSLITMPKSVGISLIDLSNIMEHEKPNFVITIGDRFETIATAIAAAYLNIPLAHVMGGEISGTIDESVRHSVTKLAHVHFPATELSAARLEKMGENPNTVFNFGCPRIDLVKSIIESPLNPENVNSEINSIGVGSKIDITLPFILFSYHPVTSEFSSIEQNIKIILEALDRLKIQVIGLWPNSDAGYEQISKELRIWQQKSKDYPVRLVKNLSTDLYFTLMNLTLCQIGNSSSALREGAYIGTPAVNIGTRQHGRECGSNVIFTENTVGQILSAVKRQILHGKYENSNLFGDGQAGQKIVETLINTDVITQKMMSY
jgi:UDP-hydrolysing UDP-N-acetyl-D-glucosamine 2-epimerase